MKKAMGLLAATMALTGGLPEVKVSAKMKRQIKDRRKIEPPRSMTEKEKEYYKIHKNLNGFN